MNQNEDHSLLSIQINDYDSYQSIPTKLDHLYSQVVQVPIIRIYGSISIDTTEGTNHQKQVFNCLIHVHNYFPYIYVDCFEINGEKLVDSSHIDYVTNYLEQALDNSFRFSRNRDTEQEDDVINELDSDLALQDLKARKYIASVSIGNAVPIYGYQVGNRPFYKINLLSPVYKTRLIKLFKDGKLDLIQNSDRPSVANYEVYEGHLPYITQFLTDYNLFGCGWLNIRNSQGLYFRSPIIGSGNAYSHSQLEALILFLETFINKSNVLISNDGVDKYSRIGKSILEIDILTSIIDNRNQIIPRYIHNDFYEYNQYTKVVATASTNSQSEQRQIYLSSLVHVYDDLKFQLKQRNSSFQLEEMVNLQLTHRFGTGSTPWSNQAELDELVEYVVKLSKTTNLSMDTFASKNLGSKLVKLNQQITFPTCFELVDIDKTMKKHNFPLRFDSDLLKWTKYSSLFQILSPSEGSNDNSMNTPRTENTTGPSKPPASDLNDVSEEGITKLMLEMSFSDFSENAASGEIKAFAIEPDDDTDEDISSFDTDILDDEINNEIIEEVNDEINVEINDDNDNDNDKDINDDNDVNNNDIKDDNENINNDITDNFEITQVQELDNKILMQTQRSQKQTTNPNGSFQLDSSFTYVQVPSSFTMENEDTPIQSSAIMSSYSLSDTSNSYEVRVPDNLKKTTILDDLEQQGILKIKYQVPYYDKKSDIPSKPFIFANKKISIPLVTNDLIKVLPMSSKILNHLKQTIIDDTPQLGKTSSWQYLLEPPLKSEVNLWLKERINSKLNFKKYRSQIETENPNTNSYKFSYNSEKVIRKNDGFNNLTCFHLELHCNTFDKTRFPDPAVDEISAIFYSFDDTNMMFPKNSNNGILINFKHSNNRQILKRLQNFLPSHLSIRLFDSEINMVGALSTLIEGFDPDILSGYEVNSNSWGYIIERFRSVHDTNLLSEFGRGKFKSNGKLGDRWGYTHTSNIKLNGRHMLNVWRILRSDLSLTNYSLENISYHLLHQSLPKYLNFQLSKWMTSKSFLNVLFMLKYYLRRIELISKLIEVQEIITRNVEHSRIIGIDFNANFYRGSQFKVESIFARLTKLENILLNSPSKQDVLNMRALECIPLIMEPDSNFYRSPLVVLDFQSLYPSIMIAYNYCFSTFIGRLRNFKPNMNSVGYLKHLRIPPGLIDLIRKHDGLNVSPNGCMFVKSSIRKSILAKMLDELLNTRQAVKQLMKLFKDDKELLKVCDARQLALKLIANVTYGYTSATFSGRMPNSDISDAIVATGREILMKSIEMIDTGNYGAKVVYGDTDSLFVYFPGKSKSEAFSIGRKIAETISNEFPDPIKLKFEKVYHPCVLLAKKRYVGYSYEQEDQVEPKFDAKGIETVRRDGIPAQQKMVEKTLRILFETANISKVKEYTLSQFHKILLNKISINDFCFAKEVRYGTYKNEKYLPPGAILAEAMVQKDHRKEPQYKERVPYVVVFDPKKTRIKDRVMSPEDFINTYKSDNPLILDYEYYITRVLIPPIARVFNLIGADIKSWYKELPKYSQLKINGISVFNENFITSYVTSVACFICGKNLLENKSKLKYICNACSKDELKLISNILLSQKRMEMKVIAVEKTCETCVAINFAELGINAATSLGDSCCNRTCSVYYNKFKIRNENSRVGERNDILIQDLQW